MSSGKKIDFSDFTEKIYQSNSIDDVLKEVDAIESDIIDLAKELGMEEMTDEEYEICKEAAEMITVASGIRTVGTTSMVPPSDSNDIVIATTLYSVASKVIFTAVLYAFRSGEGRKIQEDDESGDCEEVPESMDVLKQWFS